VKKENFTTTNPVTTNTNRVTNTINPLSTTSFLSTLVPITTSSANSLSKQPISVQLRSEIGRVLGISPLRIYNLKYEGNIDLNSLNINFDILDSNVNQKVLNEISKDDATKLAINLVSQDNFYVKINNKTIILRYLKTKKSKNLAFFDNEGLKELEKYANDRYISVPNDESLTKFYTLEHDTNYKLVPKI